MSFLAGLPSEFEIAKSQILSGSEIFSLQDAFSRVLRTESSPNVQSPLPNSALVSHHNTFEAGKQQYRSGSGNKGIRFNNSDKNFGTRGQESREIVSLLSQARSSQTGLSETSVSETSICPCCIYS